MSNQWKETAWSGVRFKTPDNWDILKIGKQYILFENETGPTLEIKWNTIKGTFSHQNHIRHLNSLHGRKKTGKIVSWDIPRSWTKSIKTFEVSGFSWKQEELRGKGIILFCPTCNKATLMQFFHTGADIDDEPAVRVLNSFKDHHSGDRLMWSVYDIRAVLPKAFEIDRYRFEPGNFRLVFTTHNHIIYFHRWSPAHMILSGMDLNAFAQTRIPSLSTQPYYQTTETPDEMEWERIIETATWAKWRTRLSRKTSHSRIRIRHDHGSNRILAIQAEGRQPFDHTLFQELFTGYESY